jgi:hypothetical protein
VSYGLHGEPGRRVEGARLTIVRDDSCERRRATLRVRRNNDNRKNGGFQFKGRPMRLNSSQKGTECGTVELWLRWFLYILSWVESGSSREISISAVPLQAIVG